MTSAKAQITITDIYKRAEEAFKRGDNVCRVCRLCDGVRCAGELPGMGGIGTGTSFINNFKALAKHHLNLRTIHGAKDPRMDIKLFGMELSAPILGACVVGAVQNFRGIMEEHELVHSMLAGCVTAGTIGMTGDGPNPVIFNTGLQVVKELGGKAIPITKPRPNPEIIKRIRMAEEAGAPAVGIDIDAAGFLPMKAMGDPVEPKTVEDIRELVESTGLPLILKGIMTPDQAEMAVRAGAGAIVVSNHGGRALDFTPGTADVLPSITEAVKGDIVLLVDGGIRSGVDVLKCLALGADAALIGRPMAIAAIGAGVEGASFVFGKMKGELKSAMILTGCATLKDIGQAVLYKEGEM